MPVNSNRFSKVRENPRISVNKLAEYMTATASRRRSIVAQQKRPPTFMVIWYDATHEAIKNFIGSGADNEEIIVKAIERLINSTPQNENEEQKNNDNIDALTAFYDSYEKLDLKEFKIAVGSNDQPKYELSEIQISVRPEFILRTTYRNELCCGLLKLYLSKNNPLTEESAAYIATLLQLYSNDNGDSDRKTIGRHCLVYDVFAKNVFMAPKSTTRRVRDLEMACQEIKLHWDAI